MNGAGLRQPGRVGCGRWTLPLGRFLLRDIRGPSAASGKVSSEKRAGPWADVPGGVLVKCVQNGLPLPWQEGLATHPGHPEIRAVVSTGEASGSQGPLCGTGDG